MKPMSRRTFLPLAGALASAPQACTERPASQPAGKSAVAVLKADSYSANLADLLVRGARLCGLDARGKRVLLKPNLVEFDSANCINTDVAVVAAVVELFEHLGAAEVLIGEGPGHRRDTLYLAGEAHYRDLIPGFDERFVDLNLDEVSAVNGYGDGQIYLPRTALGADLVVSIPKMKAHHWVGATLSMKNLFGLVPGSASPSWTGLWAWKGTDRFRASRNHAESW